MDQKKAKLASAHFSYSDPCQSVSHACSAAPWPVSSADSTQARTQRLRQNGLLSPCNRLLRLYNRCPNPMARTRFMLWAVYQQDLDPLNNRFLSTLFAALPVVVLFWLLVPRRWLAPKAAAAAALSAVMVAWLVFQMPLGM